jgi:serine/threonine protein kinase
MESLPDAVIGHVREVVMEPDFSGSRYELLGEIGSGGMGVVYLGLDKELGRRVALKVLRILDAGGQAAQRMADEARVLARLEHPGIVPVHDLGTLPDGRIFYAMKFVAGTRLDRYAQGEAPLADRLRVFLRICETVSFAHSQDVIHRDLKPANIMVGPYGEVLVLDWGVAKIAGLANESLLAVGTPGYMAPEQAAGNVDQVDARSDIYALGKTLEGLLATRGSQIPKRLQAIWKKAASADRATRYATVPDLAREIERFQSGEPVLAYRETIVERLGRLVSRNRTLVMLVAAYLAMRILLFLFTRR